MRAEVQEILEKRDSISLLKEEIRDAIQEAQGRSVKVLPSFEEHGWSRLDIFTKRLREALDDPLAEEARQILERVGLLLDLTSIKEAVRERRQEALELAKQIATNLSEVQESEVHKRAGDEVCNLLKRGEWDEAMSRTEEWKQLCIEYEQLKQEPSSRIRTLALNEIVGQGPSSSTLILFNTLKKQAIALGGTTLWVIVSKDNHKDLDSAKASLDKLSVLKGELEQVKGDQPSLGNLLKGRTNVAAMHEALQREIKECRRQLSENLAELEVLLRRVNNLSGLAEEVQEEAKQFTSLKESQDYCAYLQKRLEKLRLTIRKSLNDDAIILAEALTQRHLPQDWDNVKTVAALKQLLEKCSLRLEV
jgi:hypothetical protein